MSVKACNAREALIQKIGKKPEDFTEAEWDILLAHTHNCLVCRRDSMEAEKILAKYLKSAIGDYYRPPAKVLQFKPRAGKKPKRLK